MTDSLRNSLQSALGSGYRVERELGGGGMSRVFVARDLALDRDVVVKVLDRESTTGVSGDRFRREIQVIARLQHPHIMPILSAGTADGALYYVMPFMGGETLRARLAREGPMGVADASRVLREVLDALAFAHRHGVIHRDIKPENVLVEAGHAIVADFGIAKALRDSGTMTSAGVALGTPAYMSPEQATADPTADHRADLYAVGILAYELLVGMPPFSGSTQQIITAHLATPPAPVRDRRSDVPDALSSLVARALAKDPAERPQTAGEMMAALDAAVTPSATTPAPSAMRAPAKTTALPWRSIAFSAAAFAIAAVGLIAWRDRAAQPMVAAGADLIAVMPLGAVSDTSLARLGQDLVVTLSTSLDGVGSLRTVDAATLLMRTRKLAQPIQLADAQRLARELGARSVLTGTIIHEGSNARASVALFQVGSDSALARVTAVAPVGQIAALNDSIAWGILRQVWRRGTPPSPLLTGLTTGSMEALRSFLDAERLFQRLDIDQALTSYRRAFEHDSNFVQAFLRYDYANNWLLRPADPEVRSRLQALIDKLPERERLWVETRHSGLPTPAMVARWKELAVRYPDYPPILMSAADEIIHEGPLHGIPIAESRSYLDRLDELVPEHADTKFHRAIVAYTIGTRAEEAVRAEEVVKVADSTWSVLWDFSAAVARAKASGQPLPPPERAFAAARRIARESAGNQTFTTLTGTIGLIGTDFGYRLNVLDAVRRAGIYDGDLALSSAHGEGLLRIGRGDWSGGLEALRRSESSSLSLSARLTSARAAALGAWLEVVDPTVADSTLARVRRMRGAENGTLDRVELRWLDGLIGVARGDSGRVQVVISQLASDTVAESRKAQRSLRGLWLHRSQQDAAADSLRVLSEEAMRDGRSFLAIEAVDRLVIARSLRRRGAPADAERYLMFIDAATNNPRLNSVQSFMYPLVAYERGVALDEAGQPEAAAYQLRRVVEALDMPPEKHRSLLEDARQRMARIEKGDAPVQKRVGEKKS